MIKVALHDEPMAPMQQADIDYAELFIIATKHSVANTIADMICSCCDAPEEVKSDFKKQKGIIVAQRVLMIHALKDLYCRLDENQIQGVFLKGTLLKDLYPDEFLRSMSDIDVFAEERDMDKIHSIMIADGYVPGTIGQGNHYEYSLHDMVKVEYHPELVALDSEYGKTVFSKLNAGNETVASYMDIWNHTIAIEDHTFARQLTPEYHYVYVIMHMLNHFLTAGTGIRSIMDVWVMNSHYTNKWDRSTLDTILARFGLQRFEKYAVALADRWFDLSGVISVDENLNDNVLEEFERYILYSGTYGNIENSTATEMDHNMSVGKRFKYLMKAFFRPYSTMKSLYPVLTKAPFLLPAMWIYRPIDIFHNRRTTAVRKLNAALKPDVKRVEESKSLIDSLL